MHPYILIGFCHSTLHRVLQYGFVSSRRLISLAIHPDEPPSTQCMLLHLHLLHLGKELFKIAASKEGTGHSQLDRRLLRCGQFDFEYSRLNESI